jgi:polyisoprenoid-binding protein YceI
MRMRAALFSLLFMTAPAFAEQVNLLPAGSHVEFRAYGLGLLPFDGKFARYHGVLRYDPGKPQLCQVMLEIDAASLEMSSTSVRDQVTGPEFMDVARFPDLAFDGACQGDIIAGDLRLHGQTHPFALELTRSGGTMTATGRLKRAEWGITARPFTAGSTIRIRVELPDPANGAHG